MLDLNIETSEDEELLRSLMIEFQNISEKNKKISKNNQFKKLLQTIDIGSIQSQGLEVLDYDSIVSEQGEMRAAITRSQRTLKHLEQLKEKCPTCDQPIDRSVEKSMIVAEHTSLEKSKERESELTKEIKRIKKHNDKFFTNEKSRTDWENLYRSIDRNLPSQSINPEQLDSRIQGLQERLQEAKNRISEIAGENEKRTKRNTRIQVIKEQTNEFIKQLEECVKEIEIQNKLESNLEILKKSFSTNGLLAYKIENLVKELEELANEYLAELSDGRFTLEFVVSNDKLNVQITDNGNIVNILALSSGELARVNTATLIAIRKLMSSISKSRINVLFLDEVINVLDEAGREKLIEVLLEEDLNTYVVSHGWTHPLLEKIEVIKHGNVSGLE
jgi:DNA repair exonuclease SbcCD ATPase subunit